MRRCGIVIGFVIAVSPPLGWAAAQDLSATELQGRNLLNQNCAVCHLKPQFGAKTFGPVLNRETLSGDARAVIEFVSIGTQRMPGFRYRLSSSQIEAIAAYLKTVPATPLSASQR